MDLSRLILTKSLDRLIPVLARIPEERLLSLPWVRRGLDSIVYPEGREFLKGLILMGRKVVRERVENCGQKLVVNLLVNQMLLSGPKRRAFAEREGFYPLYLLVISPTMRCNLRCYGCYTGSYSRADDLDFETLDRVLTEDEQMGIYFITVSGGEPFVYEPLLELFARHADVYFQVYTNGTLIDRALAGELFRLGNVLPAISVEGFREETNSRRGPGAFERILKAMEALLEAGVAFGFSVTATRQNNELIVSDEFIDIYIERGCLIGWYFNYVPIGRRPEVGLMPTPQQRDYRRRQLEILRRTKPILLADFWNDGPLVGGCIAGGGAYLHINNRGDVGPCVFAHFAVDNIKQKSLIEVLRSDLFRARQPYSPNLLQPCMIIDHPWVLREVVAESGARPTHPGAETIITQLASFLDRYAAAYAEIADLAWEREYRATSLAANL